MRKRLKKAVHFAFNCEPYSYSYFFYCKGMIPTAMADFSKFNDDEAYVTCKACKREIKRQARIEQGSKKEWNQ
jgi:hypothetical protein